jgi:hypothetical protein
MTSSWIRSGFEISSGYYAVIPRRTTEPGSLHPLNALRRPLNQGIVIDHQDSA